MTTLKESLTEIIHNINQQATQKHPQLTHNDNLSTPILKGPHYYAIYYIHPQYTTISIRKRQTGGQARNITLPHNNPNYIQQLHKIPQALTKTTIQEIIETITN